MGRLRTRNSLPRTRRNSRPALEYRRKNRIPCERLQPLQSDPLFEPAGTVSHNENGKRFVSKSFGHGFDVRHLDEHNIFNVRRTFDSLAKTCCRHSTRQIRTKLRFDIDRKRSTITLYCVGIGNGYMNPNDALVRFVVQGYEYLLQTA